jgi:adenosylhomocysteine nucleosidase
VDTSAENSPVLVIVALPGELGPLAQHAVALLDRQGLRFAGALRDRAGQPQVVHVVAGIGKVRAAQATSLGIERFRPRLVLSLGVCGGLKPGQRVGDFVHCERAVQADSALRQDREYVPDAAWAAAWERAQPGRRGWFLTADRPALSPWRRLRLARAFGGSPVAEMETAAVAAVAQQAGVPWAALRVISDTLGLTRAARFRANYPTQAGRAAASVPALLGLAPDPGSQGGAAQARA